MLARVAAPVALAASLLAARAVAQEFPPPAEAAQLSQATPGRSWRVPLGVGLSYALPTGSIDEKTLKLADAFGGGPTLRLDAGLAVESVGLSFVWRRGFLSAGEKWCPTGQSCTARFDSVGGALTVASAKNEAVAPLLMIGGATDEGEVKWSGGFQRITGWEVFLSLFVGGRLGDASSPWKLGGYFDARIMSLDTVETPAGKTKLPVATSGMPTFFELGLRAAFD